MTDSNAPEHDAAAADETEETAEQRLENERLEDELAPEESLLEGWLPTPTPTDGPAPAP